MGAASRQRREAAQRGGRDASDDALRPDCGPAVSIALAGGLSPLVTVRCGVGAGTTGLSACFFLLAHPSRSWLGRALFQVFSYVPFPVTLPPPSSAEPGRQMLTSSAPWCGGGEVRTNKWPGSPAVGDRAKAKERQPCLQASLCTVLLPSRLRRLQAG